MEVGKALDEDVQESQPAIRVDRVGLDALGSVRDEVVGPSRDLPVAVASVEGVDPPARGVPQPDVAVETSDLAMLRGVLLNSDLLTAISPQQIAYELRSKLLTVLPFPLPDTRRVIGITRRADSLASPGARIVMEEITRRCATMD